MQKIFFLFIIIFFHSASALALLENEVCVLNALSNRAGVPERLFPSRTLKKYNTELTGKATFDAGTLEKLSNAYHAQNVPEFVSRLALNIPEESKYILWTKDQRALFTFNQTYYEKGYLQQMTKSGRLKEIKNSPSGLIMNSWYVHPKMKTPGGPQKISEIEANGEKFLATILDLSPGDLPHLKALKEEISRELKGTFGVTDRDRVKLYFHFPTAPNTVGLHLHARVNHPTHGLEKSRKFDLDSVISHLESNRPMSELILKRQTEMGIFFGDKDFAGEFVEQVQRGVVETVANPFRDTHARPFP